MEQDTGRIEENRNECHFSPDDPRFAELDEYIESIKDQKGVKIMVLQEAQRLFGYLPLEIQKHIAEKLDVSVGQLYGITTFYSQFNLTKQGKHRISVCMGTACYVKGAQAIMEALQTELGIEAGGISEDGMFTLDATRCLGCCSLAPVIMIDDDVYAKLSDTTVLPEILEKYYLAEEAENEVDEL
ncbi:MAG: NAD(P)H-dependent oxidoreductase subunit E [Anaerovoracaceae bacterium]|jgi:NADH:ubiquinone oxidoreductase subunit E